MTTTMEEQNATLRAAVAERLANTPSTNTYTLADFGSPVERKTCQDSLQETYSEWKPPAYAAPVVVGEDVLNEWGEFTREEPRQTGDGDLYNEFLRLNEDEPRQTGDGVLSERPTVAEQTLQSALEAVRDRHGKYGPPNEHFGRTASLVNAAFGTSFTAADWALVMVLDKVARLRGPTPTTDGGVDIAGYGGCYEECRSTLP
jgi:hypothetical protein